MKKLILAAVALAFAFAISSCCDQSYCPGNKKCAVKGEKYDENVRPGDEPPYRGDTKDQQQSGQERQHRRW